MKLKIASGQKNVSQRSVSGSRDRAHEGRDGKIETKPKTGVLVSEEMVFMVQMAEG